MRTARAAREAEARRRWRIPLHASYALAPTHSLLPPTTRYSSCALAPTPSLVLAPVLHCYAPVLKLASALGAAGGNRKGGKGGKEESKKVRSPGDVGPVPLCATPLQVRRRSSCCCCLWRRCCCLGRRCLLLLFMETVMLLFLEVMRLFMEAMLTWTGVCVCAEGGGAAGGKAGRGCRTGERRKRGRRRETARYPPYTHTTLSTPSPFRGCSCIPTVEKTVGCCLTVDNGRALFVSL